MQREGERDTGTERHTHREMKREKQPLQYIGHKVDGGKRENLFIQPEQKLDIMVFMSPYWINWKERKRRW